MSFVGQSSPGSSIADDEVADSIMRSGSVANATTSGSPQPETLDEEWRRHVAADIAIGALLSLFVVFAVAGNVLVIVAILTDRTLRQTGNYFLVSLAVADTLVGVAVMTFAAANDVLGRWPFGAVVCDLWLSADVMCSTASILNLCAVSLDRYVHIRSPLHYGRLVTHRRVLAAIGLVWILSALISFLPIQLGWHRPHSSVVGALDDMSHTTSSSSISSISSSSSFADVSFPSNTTSSPSSVFEPSDASFTTVGYSEAGNTYDPSSDMCILELSPLYAVVSSMVSFFLPCFAMMFFYVNLHRYARQHAESIRKSNCFSSSSPSTSASTRAVVSSPALLTLAAPPSAAAASIQCQPSSTSSSPTAMRKYRPHGGSTSGSSGALMAAAHRSASEHKAAITLGIIMGVFLFCWVPFFTINVIAAFCHGGECIPKIVFGIFTWLGYLNSTMNPIIYSVFNRQFRDAFKRVLNIRFRRDIDCRSSSEGGSRYRGDSVGGRYTDLVSCCCCCCRTKIDTDGFRCDTGNGKRWRNGCHVNGSSSLRLRCDGRDAVAPSLSYDHVTASTYAHSSSMLLSSSGRDFTSLSCGGASGLDAAAAHAGLIAMTMTTDL